MIKALDCYVEAIITMNSTKTGKPGYSILKKIPAVMLGSIEPRLKLLDTLATGRQVRIGLITRPADNRFIGLFMQDDKSTFDDGEVVLEEEMTTENLVKLVDADVLTMDKATKQLYRKGKR